MSILQDIKKHFNIAEWGEGFFDINPDGEVVVNLAENKSISLIEIVKYAKNLDMQLPFSIQFPGILKNRVNQLTQAFSKAIVDTDYSGKYTPVYPIKANQKQNVVETLFDADVNLGLESGSKAEFMAILSVASPGKAMLVCNGYKDEDYIRMALIGTALGHKIFIVIEKVSELELILRLSKEMSIVPVLGIRARLSTVDCAKGQHYSGERAKFGLSACQIIYTVDKLKQCELLDSLQMLHFHMGTQLSNIRNIYQGIQEGARIYATLQKLEVKLTTINVGGGLAVDYEGTRSRSLNSKNYGLYEYAYHITHSLKECCQQNNIAMPNIVTEAGRSMTAHHSILLCEVIDAETYSSREKISYQLENIHPTIKELKKILQDIAIKSPIEAYHDTMYWQDEINHLFNMGILDLHDKAIAEATVLDITSRLMAMLEPSLQAHRNVYDLLANKLSNKLFGNFSIFRSIPDVWALDQIFPIIPIDGLDQILDTKFVLADITCDSDGAFNHYIDGQSVEKTMTLSRNVGRNSILGVFLVGAYQDIMGDNHNLFGKTNEIIVSYLNGNINIECAFKGDSMEQVLTEVRYTKSQILSKINLQIEDSALDDEMQQSYKQDIINFLAGYTYLEY